MESAATSGISEMLDKATIGESAEVEAATRAVYNIEHGRAAGAARANAVGVGGAPNILVRRGLLGNGVAERLAEDGWVPQAIFSARDRNQASQIDDCKSQ